MAGVYGTKWSKRKTTSFVEYIEETWKNKLCAIALALGGLVPMMYDNDATAFVFVLFIAVPMFFSKKSWIY